ncbi:leucine-rich repeat serine/threonine-protein kinase 1-like [Cynoglossus semilaevis]|uniref:leucine-rich repeat serine/threonine-protein kinase 1-like n=1 Tax=Cynoglossus semilaevis TaxID=244447 RepID=UPI0007DC85C9|nr:leucine-rich repeat serine/threonine-protein kinase 1-like [Cynoglossus semilaevis]
MQMFCYSHSLHNPYFDLCSSSFHCCLAKVDMFSYGMVLYELLSGRRPALGQHQLQIAKKLSKGVRPALGNPEEVQFHCLHRMLTECWDTKPERRPLALQCVRQMQDPSFPCLRYVLSCDIHSQLFLSELQGHSAVFWSYDKDGRNYSVINVQKAQMEVKRMSCPGGRISCQMKTATTLWIATEEQEVFIYSLKDMCPLSQPQKHFCCPAMVTCLFPVPAPQQVYTPTHTHTHTHSNPPSPPSPITLVSGNSWIHFKGNQ